MLTLIKYIFILGLIAAVVSSCSTLNKDECKTANWRTIGYEDGTKGYEASRIGQHRSACAEYGIQPDLNTYNKGRGEGLRNYCTPNTAYNKGLAGDSYNGVCAGYNEKEFIVALNYGLTIYEKKRRLNNLKYRYAENENDVTLMENDLHEKEAKLVSGKLSKVKALIILNETKEIAVKLGKAKNNLQQLNNEIYELTKRVEDLKSQKNYR